MHTDVMTRLGIAAGQLGQEKAAAGFGALVAGAGRRMLPQARKLLPQARPFAAPAQQQARRFLGAAPRALPAPGAPALSAPEVLRWRARVMPTQALAGAGPRALPAPGPRALPEPATRGLPGPEPAPLRARVMPTTAARPMPGAGQRALYDDTFFPSPGAGPRPAPGGAGPVFGRPVPRPSRFSPDPGPAPGGTTAAGGGTATGGGGGGTAAGGGSTATGGGGTGGGTGGGGTATAPPPGGSRWPSRRALGFGALGTAAATAPFAYGHASNAIHDAHNGPAEQFTQAQEQYRAMLGDQTRAIAQRAAYEASPAYSGFFNQMGRAAGLGGPSADELRQQLATGEFGGSGGRSLLNPWGQENAAGQLTRAGQAATALTDQYDQAVARQSAPPPELAAQIDQLEQLRGTAVLPEQQQMIDGELNRLRGQVASFQGADSPEVRQLRHRLASLGLMNFSERELPTQGGAGGGLPASNALSGFRPSADPNWQTFLGMEAGANPAGPNGTPFLAGPNRAEADLTSLQDEIQNYAVDPEHGDYYGFQARP